MAHACYILMEAAAGRSPEPRSLTEESVSKRRKPFPGSVAPLCVQAFVRHVRDSEFDFQHLKKKFKKKENLEQAIKSKK